MENKSKIKIVFAVLLCAGFFTSVFLNSTGIKEAQAGILFSWFGEEEITAPVRDDNELLNPEDYGLPATAKEIPAKRTAQTATFEISPGKFAAVGIPDYMFAKDEEGNWVIADNIGYEEGDFYVFDRLKGGVRVKFDLNRPRYILEKDDYWVLVSFNTPAKGIADGQKIAYKLSDSATLVWKVSDNKIEKRIEVSGPLEPDLDLSFLIDNSDNLTSEFANNIITYKNSEGKAVFSSKAPLLTNMEGAPLAVPVSLKKLLRKESNWFYYSYSEDNLDYPYVIDPSQSQSSPASIASGNHGYCGYSRCAWTTSGNLDAVDEIYETAEVNTGGHTETLEAFDFGFGIPSGAGITEVRSAWSGYGVPDASVGETTLTVQAYSAFSTDGGTNWVSTTGADFNAEFFPDGAQAQSIMEFNRTDSLVTNLSSSDINNANFGVRLHGSNGGWTVGAWSDLFVDSVEVTVYYSSSCSGNEGVTVSPTSGLTTTEAGGTDTFDITLTGDSNPTSDVTITSLISGDTGEGTVSPSSLTFSATGTPQTVTVTGVNDSVVDGDQAYVITTGTTSSSDSCYNGLSIANVSVTNTDDDTLADWVNCGDSLTYGGDTYNTVEIGSQCWMQENLNVGTCVTGATEQANTGTAVGAGCDGSDVNQVQIEKYCYNDNEDNCYNDDGDDSNDYGGLYQWDEAMAYSDIAGAQGICPGDWHIPTDEEWKTLEGTVDSTYGVGDPEWDGTSWRGNDVGTELRSTGANDFKGLLAGHRFSNGSFNNLGTYGNFWSSLESGSSAWTRYLISSYATVYRNTNSKAYGFSLRCLKSNYSSGSDTPDPITVGGGSSIRTESVRNPSSPQELVEQGLSKEVIEKQLASYQKSPPWFFFSTGNTNNFLLAQYENSQLSNDDLSYRRLLNPKNLPIKTPLVAFIPAFWGAPTSGVKVKLEFNPDIVIEPTSGQEGYLPSSGVVINKLQEIVGGELKEIEYSTKKTFTSPTGVKEGMTAEETFVTATTLRFDEPGDYKISLLNADNNKTISEWSVTAVSGSGFSASDKKLANQVGVPEEAVDTSEMASDEDLERVSAKNEIEATKDLGDEEESAEATRLKFSYDYLLPKNDEGFLGVPGSDKSEEQWKANFSSLRANKAKIDTIVTNNLRALGEVKFGEGSIGFEEDRVIHGNADPGIVFGYGTDSTFSFRDADSDTDEGGLNDLMTLTDTGNTGDLWVSGGGGFDGELAIGRRETSGNAALHVVSAGQPIFDVYNNSKWGASGVQYRKTRGTPDNPLLLQNGDAMGTVQMRGWKDWRDSNGNLVNEGFAGSSDANIRIVVDSVGTIIRDNVENTFYGTRWEFKNKGTDSQLHTNLLIKETGNIGVGGVANANDPLPHRFTVNGGNIGVDVDSYFNWGTDDGESGYGLRDNSGTIQFKNSGGDWADLGSGGGGSGLPTGTNGQILRSDGTDWLATSDLSIDDTGKVVIGTPLVGGEDPVTKLSVYGIVEANGFTTRGSVITGKDFIKFTDSVATLRNNGALHITGNNPSDIIATFGKDASNDNFFNVVGAKVGFNGVAYQWPSVSPSDGEVLKFDANTNALVWGASASGGLLPSADDKQILRYNTNSSTWEAETLSADKITSGEFDVARIPDLNVSKLITGGATDDGKVLTVDGSGNASWQTPTTITDKSIGDLLDVDLTGLAGDKILKYDSTGNKFVLADDDTGTGGDSDWSEESNYIKAKAGGIANNTATLLGDNTDTHINLGFNSTTGSSVDSSRGKYATVVGGYENIASGNYSTAMGGETTASGIASTAMGGKTTASGDGSTAMGGETTASGGFSTAMGGKTTASGYYSTAMGQETTASGDGSTAMGGETTASGSYSIAMGQETTAWGMGSTAMGGETTASGYYSTAMGGETTASGHYSTAMGRGITAQGNYSVAIALANLSNTTVTQQNTMAIIGGNVGIGTVSPGGLLGLGNENTYLDVDNGGNLTFTDGVSGSKTLADLVGGGIEDISSFTTDDLTEGTSNKYFPGFGALAIGDIPDLPSAKITSGEFDVARIPNLDVSKLIVTGSNNEGKILTINSGGNPAWELPDTKSTKLASFTVEFAIFNDNSEFIEINLGNSSPELVARGNSTSDTSDDPLLISGSQQNSPFVSNANSEIFVNTGIIASQILSEYPSLVGSALPEIKTTVIGSKIKIELVSADLISNDWDIDPNSSKTDLNPPFGTIKINVTAMQN